MAQHYRFAYGFLKGFTFQRQAELQEALTSEPNEFLTWLWEQSADGPSAPPTGLAARTFLHGDRTLALVTMPEPQEPPEAYFVLIRFGSSPDYYTLEKSDPDFGGSGTILGCWQPDGSRYNLGDGGPPDAQAFVDTVLAILDERNPQED